MRETCVQVPRSVWRPVRSRSNLFYCGRRLLRPYGVNNDKMFLFFRGAQQAGCALRRLARTKYYCLNHSSKEIRALGATLRLRIPSTRVESWHGSIQAYSERQPSFPLLCLAQQLDPQNRYEYAFPDRARVGKSLVLDRIP